MALISSQRANLLGPSLVIAPERYDPRRSLRAAEKSVPLGEIVKTIRITAQPKDSPGPFLVFDTTDARKGIIVARKHPTYDFGSAKKSLEPGDVIISRLRPYLRQVAFVDGAIPNMEHAALLCSTEFFVLRGLGSESVAFLVPFLLSAQVQGVLAASQEGGHHPRFDELTLLALPLPTSVVENRRATSAAMEESIRLYRESERTIINLVAEANTRMAKP